MSVCLDFPNVFQIFGQWLFDWQTLISGILALVAALWAGRILNKQVQQSEMLANEQLTRQHNAARSVVPVALAAISDFCGKISGQIATAIEDRRDDFDAAVDQVLAQRNKLEKFESVEIPSEVILTIKYFIETLTDKSNVRHLAELLSSAQILQARFNSFRFTDSHSISGLYELLLDTAKIALLNDSIYNYGRFLDDNQFSLIAGKSINEAWELIHGKAQSLVFKRNSPDLFFPELAKQISSKIKHNISPWNEKLE